MPQANFHSTWALASQGGYLWQIANFGRRYATGVGGGRVDAGGGGSTAAHARRPRSVARELLVPFVLFRGGGCCGAPNASCFGGCRATPPCRARPFGLLSRSATAAATRRGGRPLVPLPPRTAPYSLAVACATFSEFCDSVSVLERQARIKSLLRPG